MDLQTFEIKNRYDGTVIFKGDYPTLKACVEDAVKKGISLENANLENANLENAILTNANLENANLWGCVGNKVNIKSLQLETYDIVYIKDFLQIGCEKHSIEDWKTFDDIRILEMDGKQALEFWNKYKSHIFNTIELSPAEHTKEGNNYDR